MELGKERERAQKVGMGEITAVQEAELPAIQATLSCVISERILNLYP
jgi:hypothetical protein